MRHPHEKFIITEIASISSAILFGIIAFIKGIVFLIFISSYLIAISLFCEGLIEWSSNERSLAGKHFAKAALLTLLTTFLLFKIK